MAETQVKVPDIGDFEAVDVVEVLVSQGDRVKKDDPLISLESDKATLDVPSPASGTVKAVLVTVGDKVSEGSPILELILDGEAEAAPPAPTEEPTPVEKPAAAEPAAAEPAAAEPKLPLEERETVTGVRAPDTGPAAGYPPAPLVVGESLPPPAPRQVARPAETEPAYASPAVRRFGRELGVDLSQVRGSGPHARITKQDVQQHVKQALKGAAPAGAGFALPPLPEIDFSQFGPVESQPLSRIQRISGPHLQRAWLHAPHVTQHADADITELEAFRKGLASEAQRREVKLTFLAFIMKACVAALRAYPTLNASLAPDGQQLIVKRYFHFGVAVDTPEGLVVPVVRDVDRKGIFELARELATISETARAGKLKRDQIQGGSFSISNLGGIGGGYFTPIINVPEVAILGVSRSELRPVYVNGELQPRLIMPLSLSYDHRVVDGATGARFITELVSILTDMRRTLL